MNQAQLFAVQEVLKKHLPEMDHYKRFALAAEIAQVVENKATPPKRWTTTESNKIAAIEGRKKRDENS